MFLKFFKKSAGAHKSQQSKRTGLVDGIDPEMNYCPSCGVEYRSDITQCHSCSIPLITGEEKIAATAEREEELQHRSLDISPEDKLIALRKGSIKDMKVLQRLLNHERIPAILAGDEASCGKGCCGPELYLQIREEDLQIATEVLAKDYVATTGLDIKDLEHAEAVFDHQAEETLCPACGGRFSPTVGACPECGLCFE